MNKWKQSFAGLVVTTISVAASADMCAPQEPPRGMIDSVLADASDIIAKKLKDRMITLDDNQLAEIDQVLIDASDIIAKKLKTG